MARYHLTFDFNSKPYIYGGELGDLKGHTGSNNTTIHQLVMESFGRMGTFIGRMMGGLLGGLIALVVSNRDCQKRFCTTIIGHQILLLGAGIIVVDFYIPPHEVGAMLRCFSVALS